jgi:hypothetical protein
MKELEGDLNEVVYMSYLASDRLENFGNEQGQHGEDIMSFASGEKAAFLFTIYEVDRRLRRLKDAYYAAYDVYGAAVSP